MGSSVGVMFNMLLSSVVDHEFIGGVMVSVDESMMYHTRDKHA
jgi:hypothetical protein